MGAIVTSTEDYVIHQVVDFLTSTAIAASGRALDKLIQDNDRALRPGESAHHGFFYEGQTYRPSYLVNWMDFKQNYQLEPLDEQFHDRMDSLLAGRNAIESDMRKVTQGLFLLLKDCENDQEIRNILPEHLVQAVPELVDLEKTVDGDVAIPKRLRKTWQQLEDLTHYYFAMKVVDA